MFERERREISIVYIVAAQFEIDAKLGEEWQMPICGLDPDHCRLSLERCQESKDISHSRRCLAKRRQGDDPEERQIDHGGGRNGRLL